MLYWLNLILSSNQGVALFRQKQIFRSNRHKNFQKQNNEDSFFELLSAWLHFINKNFPILASTEMFLDRPVFLNPQTKLDFGSDKPFFYRIPPRNIFRKSYHSYRYLQIFSTRFNLSMTFEKKLCFPTAIFKRIYKLIMEIDWKQFLRTEISQKSLLKSFYYNNKSIMKVKDFQRLSNKKISLSFSLIVQNTANL